MAIADDLTAVNSAINNLIAAADADLASGTTPIGDMAYANAGRLGRELKAVYTGHFADRVQGQIANVE